MNLKSRDEDENSLIFVYPFDGFMKVKIGIVAEDHIHHTKGRMARGLKKGQEVVEVLNWLLKSKQE